MSDRKKKFGISAVCVCLLFVLSAAVGMLTMPMRSFAAGGDTAAYDTLKFKQVASGEDFALALTYNGDLYAWSLKDDKDKTEDGKYTQTGLKYPYADKAADAGATLGDQYPAVPIRIATGVEQIAATRKTAAYIKVENNLRNIYTWGVDSKESGTGTDKLIPGNILLRDKETENSQYADIANRLLPNIINYEFDEDRLKVTQSASYTLTLSASEYNYVLLAEPASGNGTNYIWGQGIYNLLSMSGDYPFSGSATIVATTVSSVGIGTRIYPGTGTLFYYSDNTLWGKGRNYTGFPTDQDGNGMTGNIFSTPESDVGGYTHKQEGNISIPTAYMSWTSVSDSAAAPKGNNKVTLYTADGKAAQAGGGNLQIDRAPVSAGYGYVYVLGESGSVSKYGSGGVAAPSGSFVQAVAGKRLSGAPVLEGISGTEAYNNTDKWNEDGTLKDAYRDGKSYLSAFLTANGEVTVSGINGDNTIDNKKVNLTDFGIAEDANAANKVVALFGGYDNNLFLLTSLGKIVHVTANGAAVNGKLIDSFAREDGTPIENWTLDNSASITFTPGYYDTAAETGKEVRSTVTVGMYSLAENKQNRDPDKEDTASHVMLAPYKSEERGVIATNAIGDTYRMLLPAANDAVTVSGTSDGGTWVGDNNQVKFYWKNDKSKTPIEPNIAARYIKVAFTYHAPESGENPVAPYIDFTVTPVRSTQEKTIVMEYGIGRFDSATNFDASAVSAAPHFYDCKRAQLEITVANTNATPHFETATVTQGEDGQIKLEENYTIPVLDPNNPYNRYYSLAVNNVSKGLKDVVTALSDGGYGLTEEQLYAAVDNADKGFPYKNKVQKGSLAYYGQEEYYDNTYRYFVDDHDGDIYEIQQMSGNSGKAYFTNEKKPVNVKLTFDGDRVDDLTALFVGVNTQDAFVSPTFDNKYGLTFAVSKEGEGASEKTTLTVTYYVLLLEATSGMTDTYLSYEDGDVSKPVKSLDTSEAYARQNILQIRLACGNAPVVYFNNSGGRFRSVQVFTRSSLSLKGTNENAPDDYVSAADDKEHEYEYDPITLGLVAGKSRTVELSALFADTKAPAIAVTYKGEVDWDGLQGTFDENTSALKFEMKSATSFELTALRVTERTEFTVQLRRFESLGAVPEKLMHGGADAEIITVYFTVTVDFDKKTSLEKLDKENQKDPPVVNNTEIPFNLVGNRLTDASKAAFSFAEIVAGTSAPSVLTVAPERDNAGGYTGRLMLNPVSCGTAWVRYTVTVFGETVTDSFSVNVTKILQLPNSVNVSSSKRVSIGELKSDLLKQIGESKNESLDPVVDENKRVLYTLQEYKTKDGVEDWYNVESSEVFFLKHLYATDAYIGIEVQAIDGDPQKVRIVVPFKRGNITYVVAFLIEPSAQTAKDSKGNALTMKINKADKRIEILNVDNGEEVAREEDIKALSDGHYQIPQKYLIELQRGYSADESDDYIITFAAARSSDNLTDYNKYIEVMTSTTGDVWVKPLYPTGDTLCNIQVTIYNKASGTSTVVNFGMKVDGIKTTLSTSEYRTIILAAFFGVFGVLFIIFMIRMGVYWRKKAAQRRIIKKNQTLIKMRDKMHNKTEAVSKEKLVHTKLKMEDPKYAKMFSEMRKEREAQTGISLENSVVADKAERKAKAAKASKKKGKKSIADLQAELAAKREAVARMQMGDFSDMPDMAPAGDIPVMPVDGAPEGAGVPPFDQNAGFDGMTADELDAQFRAAMGDEILFDDDANNGQQG